MKTRNNSIFKYLSILLIVLAFTFSTNVHAFVGNGNSNNGNGGGGTNNNNGQNNTTSGFTQYNGNSTNNNGGKGQPTGVPLDGGLSILLLGAAAFGVKKLRDNKN